MVEGAAHGASVEALMKVYSHGPGWRFGVCRSEDAPPGFKSAPGNVGLFLERIGQPPRDGLCRDDHGVRFLGWYAACAESGCRDLLSLLPDGALSLLWLGLRPFAGMPALTSTEREP